MLPPRLAHKPVVFKGFFSNLTLGQKYLAKDSIHMTTFITLHDEDLPDESLEQSLFNSSPLSQVLFFLMLNHQEPGLC